MSAGRPPLLELPYIVELLDPLTDSPDQLPVRIAGRIREAIAAGRLRQGDRLPTSRMIARRYDVNKDTVCRALRRLEAEGLVRTVPTIGTFVRGAGGGARA